ncbi:hypothetical protein B0T26DRAFT_715685 [Lasiosphaeria miniovina]|uniref:Uncharacterized protein n=1 Tax=Lasiosphaeria miniovina TaxID=1954250 RepID=A0AA40ABR2_9PEZI|nr:uncharacterized protein B0T26DRAFT_715685 [Lasiosphaeria miniovina]KAK0712916.1 hypothetical protein B0T26DRAFT_715685 [Lasiosphaeria miniovina]
MEAAKNQYNKQYEKWVPWLEDLYLRYFTKDNKASYTARENLDKTKVTGVKQVDTLQDGVNDLVSGQIGQGGLGQSVGDLASREGMSRAERSGKDNKGEYISTDGTAAVVPGGSTVAGAGNAVAGGAASGAQQAAAGVQSGVKSVGGLMGFQRQQKP